jgi:hypothetical protein
MCDLFALGLVGMGVKFIIGEVMFACVCGHDSRGASKFPDSKCLGTRPYKLDKDGKYIRLDKDGNPDPNPKTLPVRELYKYWTYKQVQEQSTAFGAGLAKLGLNSQVRMRCWCWCLLHFFVLAWWCLLV